MELQEIVRLRTNCARDYKACAGELGCKRPVLPTYGLCRVHHMRKVRQGCVSARSPLRPGSAVLTRRPPLRGLRRFCAKDTAVLEALSEFEISEEELKITIPVKKKMMGE